MKNHPYLYILCASLLLTSCFSDENSGYDMDGDGMLDKYDACPFDPNKFLEKGECGCGNVEFYVGDEVRCLYSIEGDSDQDGLIDSEDNCPNKPFKYQPGVCGCDRYDFDMDNDGAVDTCESLPGDTSETLAQIPVPDKCPGKPKIVEGFCGCEHPDLDKDGDGYIDGCEGTDESAIAFPDECGSNQRLQVKGICGCDDTDSDDDGTLDCADLCPNDPQKDTPGICGCGVADTDDDEDNVPNCLDRCPQDPQKSHPGICGCGNDDTLDSDKDGTIDCLDKCPDDPLKANSVGVCGCGVLDADLNGNGILDCKEPCAEDTPMAGKIPGVCGCAAPDIDTDEDGVLDCLDVCPDDPNKSEEEGICGCGFDDLLDSDHDGVIDCQEECPEDPLKLTEGLCGCGIAETDTDGDGTVDCLDKCPDDPTQTEPGPCGCGYHPIIETSTNEAGEETKVTICPAEGGLLSLDNLFPGHAVHENASLASMMERYLTRTTPNHHVVAYFIPGGNVLVDPYVLKYDTYWTVPQDGSNNIFYWSDRFNGEIGGPRPFPQYIVCIGSGSSSRRGYLQQTIPNPYKDIQDVRVRIGVMGGTTYKSGGSDYYYLNDKQFNSPAYGFNFSTITQTISKDSDSFNAKFTTSSGTADSNDSSNAHGAALQGFQVFFGDPEVRFSVDGENWTEWMTYTNDSGASNMWNAEIDLPEGYGYRYAYMQTRNATLPPVTEGEEPASNVSENYIYYETSNRVMVKEPNRDGALQIGTFTTTTPLADKEAIDNAMAERTVTTKSQTLYYTPGTNLLTDSTFEDENHGKWSFTNAETSWELGANNKRTFSALPELVMGNGAASASHRLLVDESKQGEAIEVSFRTTQNSGDTIIATLKMYDDKGIILDFGDKTINAENSNYYKLSATIVDDTASMFIDIKSSSANTPGPRLQTVRVGLGNTYVRFSNDRKTWSNWEPYKATKSWTLDHCIPTEEDPQKQRCTVTVQSYDLVTREFSEASASILYH